MTETDTQPAAAEPVPVTATPTEPPDPAPTLSTPRDRLPWLSGIGFLILAGAIGAAWYYPRSVTEQATDLRPLIDQIRGLDARMARLEQRPLGTTDLAATNARLDALEHRPPPDLHLLEARIAALENRPGADNQIIARLDALSGRVEAQSGRDQSADAEFTRRLDADEARLATLERGTAQLAAVANQSARRSRIQAAESALAAGEALGTIPDAPPSVARFAAVKPPTEAELRLAYPKAEQAALAAAQPAAEGKPFLARLLAHAEDLVIVRQGDRVLVGDPAAGVLARAHTALDAGDLAGAVAAISGLSGPSADAMAGWLADAKALLGARSGLADMAAHA